MREHVHRLHFHDAPTALGEKRRVARLRLRVARNVDDTLGRKLARSFQEFRRGTRTRRIHHEHIERRPLVGHAVHVFARVGRNEFGSLDAVVTRIVAGVGHGIGALLNANHACSARIAIDAARGHKPNRARAAVRVHKHLGARKLRHLNRATIQHFRLR